MPGFILKKGSVAIVTITFTSAVSAQLHWGYKRLMRAEFNLYF
ncbi:hypothetical protein N9C27_01945 [Luminiphilus sp.]|nr:hypothetical protein [Luminiphilus sp.]